MVKGRERIVRRRILAVRCHPVRESFGGALADRITTAITTTGHELRVIDLYAEHFDPVRRRRDWTAQLGDHAAALRWCDTVVFVYPTWFGSQPAMLKGWFDRVLADSALDAPGTKRWRPRPALRNIRRIVVVTTHGSPKWMNMIQGEPGKRVILRGIRSMCHPLCQSQWVAFYDNDGCDQRARADFLNRVEAVGLRL